mgnify:CR=1 FL=1
MKIIYHLPQLINRRCTFHIVLNPVDETHHLCTLLCRIHGLEERKLGHGTIRTHKIKLCFEIVTLILKPGSGKPLNQPLRSLTLLLIHSYTFIERGVEKIFKLGSRIESRNDIIIMAFH